MEPETQLPPNSNPINSALTVGDIQSAQIPGYTDQDIFAQNQGNAQIIAAQPDPYSQSVIDTYNAQFAPEAIGPQGAGLYPGLRHNINVGGYSGSVVGSQNIYVPGGNIMAIDPVLARRKAIEDAAKARASSLVPFEAPKPFQLKDQAFQKSFNDKFFQFHNQAVEKAKKDYNKDFGVVLKDSSTKEGGEYIQGMANFEYMQKNFDQITDDISSMEKAIEEGTLNFTDEGLRAFDEYKRLAVDFGEGDIWKNKDFGQLREKLQGFVSLEYKVNDGSFLKNIMSEQTAWASNPSDKGEYYLMREGTKQSYDESIEQVADQMMEDADIRYAVRRGAYTRDDIVKTLKSRLKNQVTSEASMQQKSQATRDAETEEIIASQDAVVKYADEDGKRGQIKMFSYNEDGSRSDETWSIGSLMDIPISISGRKKTINERLPDGKIQKRDTKGITLDNISVIDSNGGSRIIPGNSIVELDESTITKLADGRIVAKSRVLIPTKTTIKGNLLTGDKEFDSYTSQDHLVYLENASGQGVGGTLTKLKERGLSTKESKETLEKRIEEAREWKGVFPSGTAEPASGETGKSR